MAAIVRCATHQEVETALRCSRCETPICPRCLVQTPVGARCRGCARIARSPIYTLTAAGYLRAALAALIGGSVMGVAWALVLLPFQFGFLSIFLGVGLSFVFTRTLDFATGRKRGPAVTGFAIAGMVLAWSFQFVFGVPVRVALPGLVAVAIGAYLAYQHLIRV